MVKLSVAFFGLVASSAYASPILEKRVAQVIAQSTAKWEQACVRRSSITFSSPVLILVTRWPLEVANVVTRSLLHRSQPFLLRLALANSKMPLTAWSILRRSSRARRWSLSLRSLFNNRETPPIPSPSPTVGRLPKILSLTASFNVSSPVSTSKFLLATFNSVLLVRYPSDAMHR